MAKGVSIEVPLYPFGVIAYGKRGDRFWRKQRIAFLLLYPFAYHLNKFGEDEGVILSSISVPQRGKGERGDLIYYLR